MFAVVVIVPYNAPQVNKAIIVDSVVGLIEETAMRPGMIMNDRWDEKNALSKWHDVAPMTVKDLEISPFGMENIKTEGGHTFDTHARCTWRRMLNVRKDTTWKRLSIAHP